MTPTEAVSSVLLLVGGALAAVAGLGLVRFPDVLSRMHAATKPATLGLVLVAAGTALRLSAASDLTKIALIVALQLLTAPVGAHLVGRAVRPRTPTSTD
ncbi:MAG: monovalent cation/H(+) antiporter subunit G [Acidimicrobiales bacterium]